jgi:hypothetical protein
MELLEICLRTTNFQFKDKSYQQKNGTEVGSSLSPVISNIFMEYSEKLVLDKRDFKNTNWLKYVDISWFGHMDQQCYGTFSITSTASA